MVLIKFSFPVLCVHVCICVCGWVCTCVEANINSHTLTFILRQGLSRKLELTDLATLSDQLGPGSLAFLPAQTRVKDACHQRPVF